MGEYLFNAGDCLGCTVRRIVEFMLYVIQDCSDVAPFPLFAVRPDCHTGAL